MGACRDASVANYANRLNFWVVTYLSGVFFSSFYFSFYKMNTNKAECELCCDVRMLKVKHHFNLPLRSCAVTSGKQVNHGHS